MYLFCLLVGVEWVLTGNIKIQPSVRKRRQLKSFARFLRIKVEMSGVIKILLQEWKRNII